MNNEDEENESTTGILVGLTFVTGDGEPGRVVGQIGNDFLIEWEDGHMTICATSEMRAKSEPEIVSGKRTGRWLKTTPAWVFSKP